MKILMLSSLPKVILNDVFFFLTLGNGMKKHNQYWFCALLLDSRFWVWLWIWLWHWIWLCFGVWYFFLNKFKIKNITKKHQQQQQLPNSHRTMNNFLCFFIRFFIFHPHTVLICFWWQEGFIYRSKCKLNLHQILPILFN